MLLGDADMVGGATLINAVLVIVTGVLTWLSARDRMRFDNEKTEMKGKIEACELDRVRINMELGHTKGDLDKAKKDLDENWALTRRLMDRMTAHGIDCTDHEKKPTP